ncbi:MAG: sensor histidine kinase [Acidobacteria bacterium]|nr:MAG: sensor histidine kinase [Acidobacteriota bacterium]
MFSRVWPVLILGFSLLLGLGLLLGLVSMQRAADNYSQTLAMHHSFQATEEALYALRSDIFLSSILLRDFFLDPSQDRTSEHREQLRELRESVQNRLEQLVQSEPPQGSPLADLRSRIDYYWNSIDPIFEWSYEEKQAQGTRFLREEVISRRRAVLDIAERIQALNQAYFRHDLGKIRARHEDFERYELNVLIIGFGLGLVVSATSSILILRLDRQGRLQQRETEKAERELRLLSQRLVKVQEEERRVISRELHDQVGQMLTGLRMEIGNLERRRSGSKEEFSAYVQETKKLIEETLQTVRDLAMGLRPSMLDDTGLAPALKWQVRDFSRRSGIPVSLKIDGPIDNLEENRRTCVYRVVQEALTNCGKHACASRVDVHIIQDDCSLTVTVEDNGRGFVGNQASRGLGLIGMEERARELGGNVTVNSEPGHGTIVRVELPLEKTPA